ncbi:hypothetical protein ACWCQP_46510 [Streptomyces chartreusis]|uniref:Uncharacterized protein n=1 Tax=Streptomyces sp. F11 TaxID=319318 RepID=V9QGH1_9ACTN|nr:hypothetical protein [Streptomyces sp. F11]AHC28148.1 hypothetical protein pFP12.5 [Streptomyces sp. F11]
MTREVYDAFSAGHPRGSWPAEERANELREQGQPATVVMDIDTDRFLVVSEGGEAAA